MCTSELIVENILVHAASGNALDPGIVCKQCSDSHGRQLNYTKVSFDFGF